MEANAFINRAAAPTEAEVAAVLGPAWSAWDQLLSDLARKQGVKDREWKCYSAKAGWSLRLKRKKRTIVWLAPCVGSFRAAFILGGKALQAARRSRFPARIVKAINEAPRYPEGTGVRLAVKTLKDVEFLEELAAIKLAN